MVVDQYWLGTSKSRPDRAPPRVAVNGCIQELKGRLLMARANTTTGAIAFTAARSQDGLADVAIRRSITERTPADGPDQRIFATRSRQNSPSIRSWTRRTSLSRTSSAWHRSTHGAELPAVPGGSRRGAARRRRGQRTQPHGGGTAAGGLPGQRHADHHREQRARGTPRCRTVSRPVTVLIQDTLDRYALVPDDSDVVVNTSGTTVASLMRSAMTGRTRPCSATGLSIAICL